MAGMAGLRAFLLLVVVSTRGLAVGSMRGLEGEGKDGRQGTETEGDVGSMHLQSIQPENYYSHGSWIACNVVGLILYLPAILNTRVLSMGKGNRDANATLAEQHRSNYGIELGLPNGDYFDAAQMGLCFLIFNFAWASHTWAQALAVMADIWYGLALVGVSAHFLAPRVPPELLGGSIAITGVLFFIGQVKLLLCGWRIILTVVSVTEYLYLILGWGLFCIIIHAKFMINFHSAALLPGSQYMYQLSAKMAIYVTSLSPTGEWEPYAPGPTGFDFAKDGPSLDGDAKMQMGLPSEPTHEDLVKYYNRFMEDNTCSRNFCMGAFFIVLAVGIGAWFAATVAAKKF